MDTFTRWLLGGAALAVVMTAVANFWDVEPGQQGGAQEWLITVAIIAIITAIIYAVGRSLLRSGGKIVVAALILGVLAVLSNAVFWLGLPAVFGGGAVGLGLWRGDAAAVSTGAEGPGMESPSRLAILAAVLGGLGALLFVFAAIFG